MITLYSGTPGSGKSLDTARTIYAWNLKKKPIICNFPVDESRLKNGLFHYVTNDKLDPDSLVKFSRDFFGNGRCKEDSILLVIDEAQLLFNSRDWSKKGRERWNWFFTMHRHFGFCIILCCQFDRMLDRQIRGLIEYEIIHRKVNNMGIKGRFLSVLMFSFSGMFCRVRVWYPMKERISAEFFRKRSKYYMLYDTFAMLDTNERSDLEDGGRKGDPSDGSQSSLATK